MREIKLKKYLPILLLLVSATFFYGYNIIIPFITDDLDAGNMFSSGHGLHTFNDLIQGTVHSYTWNGRIICNFLMQLFPCFLGETLFNVYNTIVFVLILYVFSNYLELKSNLAFLLLIVGLFSLSTPIDHLFFWGAGAANYLWPLFFIGIFLLLFSKLEKEKKSNSSIQLVGLFVVSLLLSLNHEMFVFPICVALSIHCLLHYRSLPKSSFVMLIGFVIGSMVVVLCPGNFKRLTDVASESSPFVAEVIKRIIYCLKDLRIFYLLLIGLLILFLKTRNQFKVFILGNSSLLIMIICGFVLPLYSGIFGRSLLGVEVFSLFLLCKLINENYNNRLSKVYKVSFTVVFIAFISFNLLLLKDSYFLWERYKTIVNEYITTKNNVFVIEPYDVNPIVKSKAINLFKEFNNRFCYERLAKIKCKVQAQKTTEELFVFPSFVTRDDFELYTSNLNKIEGDWGFYEWEDFYIAKYSDKLLNRIKSGELSVEYKTIGLNIFKTKKIDNDCTTGGYRSFWLYDKAGVHKYIFVSKKTVPVFLKTNKIL